MAPADEESHASTSGYCHAGPVCHPPDARSGPRFSVVSHSRSRAVPVNPGTGGGSRGLGGEDAPRHAGKPPNQTAGLAADPFAAPIGVPRPPDPRRTVCPWASRSGIACGIGAGIGQVVEWLTPSGRCKVPQGGAVRPALGLTDQYMTQNQRVSAPWVPGNRVSTIQDRVVTRPICIARSASPPLRQTS